MKPRHWWGLAFVLAWSVLMLILQGCFGEPPAIGSDIEGEAGEGEADAGESSSSSSSSSTGGSGGASSQGSIEATGESDGSSSSEGSDSGESSSSSSSSSSGDVQDDYLPCDQCVGQSHVLGEGACVCMPDCADACPDPGWGAPACLEEVADGTQSAVCFLDCTASRTCEDGMLCVETEFTASGLPLWACMWGTR